MNIPMSWLREIIPVNDTTDDFVKKATDAGIKVEGITATGEEITLVVVGQIISLTRHPDADKLWVTRVRIAPGGDAEPLQIVTGADNLKEGDYIPVALHGATLYGGLKIKKSKMRGQVSNGMLCSIGELGCTTEDFPYATDEGIYVFPEPQPLGADARPIMGLTEEVIDFEILSNRPDTNAVMGIAREVAAVYNVPFALPEIKVKETGTLTAEALVSVEIKDTAKCPRYIARVVTGVTIAPSPRWMQKRLLAANMRPVNNIVDITNYVMLEYGQPLHAFDISAVAKKDNRHAVIVRTAAPGEKITTLDGIERILNETVLLIADPEKALAIAGIMGGESTKVTEETTTILFESANFDAQNIRQSAKALGMRTDASARYEKGPDPNLAALCVDRAMELIELLGCGCVVPGKADNYPAPRLPREVPFCPGNIAGRLGISLGLEEITAFLARVEIQVRKDGDTCVALVPTFRGDITAEVDLCEEVARFYGYNKIPSRYSQLVDAQPPFTPGMDTRRRFHLAIKNTVAGLGYFEGCTYPFESPKTAEKLGLTNDNALVIDNPLGEDFSVMRTTTLGGLLNALAFNCAKRNDSARLFEMASEYVPKALPLTELPEERLKLTLAAYGAGAAYLDIKGDIEDLLGTVINGPLVFEPLAMPYMHPGRTATVAYKPYPGKEPIVLGYLGELHPQTAANFEIEARVALAVLDMDTLFAALRTRGTRFVPPPRFPALVRDLAFTVPVSVTAAQCEAAIRERGGALLAGVTLFDVYTGAQIEAGYKSLAYNLRFVAPDRTLTDDTAQKHLTAIRTHLEHKYGAKVR